MTKALNHLKWRRLNNENRPILKSKNNQGEHEIKTESERLMLKFSISTLENAFERMVNSTKILFFIGGGFLVYFLYKFFGEEGFVYTENGIQKVMSFHNPASVIPAIIFFVILFLFAFVFTRVAKLGLKLFKFIIKKAKEQKNILD